MRKHVFNYFYNLYTYIFSKLNIIYLDVKFCYKIVLFRKSLLPQYVITKKYSFRCEKNKK
jgi:hypothetical protein